MALLRCLIVVLLVFQAKGKVITEEPATEGTTELAPRVTLPGRCREILCPARCVRITGLDGCPVCNCTRPTCKGVTCDPRSECAIVISHCEIPPCVGEPTCVPKQHPRSNATEEPVTHGPGSDITEVPVTHGPGSNATEVPVTHGPRSNATEAPVTHGPGSNATEAPVTHGPVADLAEEPVTHGSLYNTTKVPKTHGTGSDTTEVPVTHIPRSNATKGPVAHHLGSDITEVPATHGPHSNTTKVPKTHGTGSDITEVPATHGPGSNTEEGPVDDIHETVNTEERATGVTEGCRQIFCIIGCERVTGTDGCPACNCTSACEGVTCGWNRKCTLEVPTSCKYPPCPPRRVCVPKEGTTRPTCPSTPISCQAPCEPDFGPDGCRGSICACPKTCQDINCTASEECRIVNVTCVRAPCFQQPQCFPNRVCPPLRCPIVCPNGIVIKKNEHGCNVCHCNEPGLTTQEQDSTPFVNQETTTGHELTTAEQH